MRKIQTLNKISAKGLDLFSRDDYEVASEFSSPDAIVLRSFKMHDMELPSSLKAIARAGAGTNNIPIDKCTEKGIVVFNTPGANANAVKELVLTGMLLASRDVIGGVNWVQSLADKGDEVVKLVEKGKSNFAGNELKGKRLGIIGLGAIGAMVANTALELGMEVIGYDPYLSVKSAWELSSEIENATGLETLLSNVDFISIHVPLLDSTRGMFNSEKFAMMKDGVSIMNFARGGLIDDADMKKAIESGKVKCYVTDFPDINVLGVKGIIPIPHLGASTAESEENCAVMAVNQIKDYLENGNIKNSVNFPDCVLPRSVCDNRITIKNRNVPNIIGEVSTTLAKNNINICDMLNKSRGDIAFNIIDVMGDLNEAVITELQAIDGVIGVRVL
ncbi:D-3-phosphoglycerate dehydrogenase [hydrothermal vent metagenome]|uniref:phosphoglycerate dehydrogenase n=1 Tax=hydrothermal vent metagenome TaxID=652676 RepID=A0A1W1C565_9ZZZZ